MAADARDTVPVDQTADLPAPPRTPSRVRRLGALAVRLLLDLLVLDAVVESWQAASPLRMTIAAIAGVYFLLTAYVLSKGGRIGGRGWLMDPGAPAIVFLGFLVACSWWADGLVHGIAALRQPTPVVLAGAFCLLALAATARMAGPGGVRTWWLRLPIAALGGYSVLAMAQATAARLLFPLLLNGHGFPARAPWWLQGTWLGIFLLLPVAFLRELGAAIARLAVFPYLRWMLIFGFGCWIAFNGLSL